MKKYVYFLLLLTMFVFMFSGCTLYVYGDEEIFTEKVFLVLAGIVAFGAGNLLFGTPIVGLICGLIFIIA